MFCGQNISGFAWPYSILTISCVAYIFLSDYLLPHTTASYHYAPGKVLSSISDLVSAGYTSQPTTHCFIHCMASFVCLKVQIYQIQPMTYTGACISKSSIGSSIATNKVTLTYKNMVAGCLFMLLFFCCEPPRPPPPFSLT